MTAVTPDAGDALIQAYADAQAALRAHSFPALTPETVTDDGETYEALRCPRCGQIVEGPDLYAVSPAEHWAPGDVIDDRAFDYGRVMFDANERPYLEETLYYSHGEPGAGHAVSLPGTWREEWV